MTLTEEKINQYLNLREEKGKQLFIKNTIGSLLHYNLTNNKIYISSVGDILGYCNYELYLKAYVSRYGLYRIPHTIESEKAMELGRNYHNLEGTRLGIPEFKEEEATTLLQEPISWVEFPISTLYKGYSFRGRLDYIQFKDDSIHFEEWKFTRRGRVDLSHKVQASIYAYLLYNWIPTKISYTIKVWKKDLPDSPSDIFNQVYKSPIGPEFYMDKLVDLYSGGRCAEPEPGPGCEWCDFGPNRRSQVTCNHRRGD